MLELSLPSCIRYMKAFIAPAILLSLLVQQPASALFTVSVPSIAEEAKEEEPTAGSPSHPQLQPVPNIPLRVALGRNAPGNVLNTDRQFKILDGLALARDEFSAPSGELKLTSAEPAAPPEPEKINVQRSSPRFGVRIPQIFQPKPEREPITSIGSSGDEYIPRGGRVGQAEKVMSDPEGAQALIEVAGHMGLDPIEFVALMSWESAGTLNPNIMGGDGNSYKGLIQFSPGNAKKYGVTEQMSIRQYAPAVKQYLLDRNFRPGEHDIRHAYSAILAGQASERFWNRKDSNGTSVRNAAPKFQSGAHYERAKAFLEASQISPQEVQPVYEEQTASIPRQSVKF